MYLTYLADVCRRAGLKVHEVDGWQKRGHAGELTSVKTIVCHHTGGSTARQDSRPMGSLNTVTYGRPGLAGPLCNLGLGRDGTVYVVAAGKAWHAGVVRHIDYINARSIGIEAQNAGTKADPWTEVQMDAYGRLCAALCVAYGLTADDVLGHKEVCDPKGRKIDPTLGFERRWNSEGHGEINSARRRSRCSLHSVCQCFVMITGCFPVDCSISQTATVLSQSWHGSPAVPMRYQFA